MEYNMFMKMFHFTVQDWRAKWHLDSRYADASPDDLIRDMADIHPHIRLKAIATCSRAAEYRPPPEMGIQIDTPTQQDTVCNICMSTRQQDHLMYGIMTEELVICEIRIDEAADGGSSDSQMTSYENIMPFELQSMSHRESTRWQHNRIYPHPINPCVYT